MLYLRIVKKSQSIERYRYELLKDLSNSLVFGVTASTNDLVTLLAGQFSNLFLTPGLHETTIGEFIKLNPTLIQLALNCESFKQECSFEWIEGNPDPNEKYIRPDLLLKRADGYYDICDLKTAKLERENITKGGHRRRRFIDYVEEGISQLANYENYFTFEKNQEYAYNKWGVKVDNPILYLVVGNYENLKQVELEEASRKLKPNFRIIDYDTLNTLFRLNES